ncbi:MAG: methyltransferase [Saprospiraceae bacterium]|nr:class I SAM-dependent methyltransferase [Saprospiraceae bacterium]MDW8228950.1 methyltransferase [Saprospiraceae bacterium]
MHPSIFTYLFFAVGLIACQSNARQSAQAGDHAPPMVQEKPSATLDALKPPTPPSDASSFESMVADYESKDRVIWQKPGLVISMLGDLTGKTVADIGAGTGYFAFRLVPAAQKVIAVDIDPRFINFMDSIKVRLPETYQRRFETRLAKPDDPMLAAEEADAIIIVNTYGYLRNRAAYLKRLAVGMKPRARLLVIDFKKNNLPIGPSDEFKVAVADAIRELEAAGFQIVQIDQESLDYQYILIAQKP